jgi:hypothetical protein
MHASFISKVCTKTFCEIFLVETRARTAARHSHFSMQHSFVIFICEIILVSKLKIYFISVNNTHLNATFCTIYFTLLSTHAHNRRGSKCSLAQIAHQTINTQRIATLFALSHYDQIVILIICISIFYGFIEKIRGCRRKACGRRVLNATSRTFAHNNHNLILFCHFMRSIQSLLQFFANSSCTTTCLYILF